MKISVPPLLLARWQLLRSALERYFHVLRDSQAGFKKRTLYLAGGVTTLILIPLVVLLFYALILFPFTPAISDLHKAKRDQPAQILSADGKEIARYFRLNREWVHLDKISPHVVHALLATEDHRFYKHHGIDFRRTVGALLKTLGGDTQGGSTITQQLARNLYPEDIGRSLSITRKLKEMITALKIEFAYTKREILETYLNTVPFLYNAYGIELAARTYFDKSAAQLEVLEAATLVGMLKGTSYYNPVLNPQRSKERRDLVLAQMVKHEFLTPARYASLKKRPLRIDFERQPLVKSLAPHFTEYLRKWLIEWADKNDYDIYADGLVVHTTLDWDVQRAAQLAVTRQAQALQAVADVEWGSAYTELISGHPAEYAYRRRGVEPFAYFWKNNTRLVDEFIKQTPQYRAALASGVSASEALRLLRADNKFMRELRAAKTRLEVGFVALDPHSGELKAWVGARDYDKDAYDHVARAQRQPGSTFKPFVYGAALQRGFSPEDTLPDVPIEIPLGGGEVWRPAQADITGREMTLAEGLAYSKNTITVQLIQKVGAGRVAELAREMGINRSKLDAVPSLALGTSPVTLLEMVSAYGTIANGGIYRTPLVVTRISDRKGNTIARFEPKTSEALSEKIAMRLLDMMRGVVDEGTGRGVRDMFGIYADVAGKTGTTQNNADGWFILMHPELVAGSWVGFNDPNIAFRSNYWGQGAHNALYVVGDFYRQLFRKYPQMQARFPPPERYEEGTIAAWIHRLEERWTGERRVAAGFGRKYAGASAGSETAVASSVKRVENWLRDLFGITVEQEHPPPPVRAVPPPRRPAPRRTPSQPDSDWEDPSIWYMPDEYDEKERQHQQERHDD